MKKNFFKRSLSAFMAVLMVLSCWVWFEPVETVNAANLTGDSNYLFAYFTGTSIDGQTIHLAVSQDGLNYTALRGNEPVIVPSKGTGCVRDPYLWYNEIDGYYYILATDLDFTDTGSDYSDNSESFIIWRSKDLVNWYDETMIDVKAMGHLIGDVNNMQAVWAPQVLYDGTSYVVYFSLQCNATSNGSWNPLTIVYLRTTDLLDQSAYYEYGVIHNPGRHVIDADIIKKPGTDQYYMFYKDESASGGIQSIYYMISDNGPTGPYYAPDNANDGRGPQLFSEIGKNLEGCNSFFDDNGNLVTFVDEYDYTNSSGQKEAHFHVSRTSDFTNYTTLPDSSHNINTLSPRHGSVVKITDEEYNRLLEYSGEITSSSFPENEDLTSHLVGRYFTTSDFKYNAANGKNDLTRTDGTISMTTDTSGDYYASFNAAGAEIKLGDLISGDLNIKDGFSITFTASAPSNLGSNARFFDISNNWSKRTNSNEVYLHMSPVADSNGLYVGAYNGPVTTSSWTWASQGRNYNDGVMHDYVISFADGNMILYIDGELAMKRDRFNMNAEYGDNFLNDNWYKEIGNSTMRIGKSEWFDASPADPLFTGSIQNLCIYDCSMSYYDVKKMQKIFDDQAGKTTVSKIVVPETVYMTPSTGESKTGQYYVNNTMHNGTNEVNLDNSINDGGIIEFFIPGAKNFIVEVNTKTSGIGDIILTEKGTSSGSYENVEYVADENGYFSYKTLGFYINGTGITAGNTALAEWKITVIMNDGSRITHYAYSTFYAPYIVPVGSAVRVKAKATGSWGKDTSVFAQTISWISGVHSINASSDGRQPNFILSSQGRGMLGFLGSQNSAYIGSTPISGVKGTVGDMYAVFASTNASTSYFRAGQSGSSLDDTGCADWFNGSSTLGIQSFDYYDTEGNPSSNYRSGLLYSKASGNITIDTSRYNNLNQIPNLGVGLLVTDNERGNTASWYVADFSDTYTYGKVTDYFQGNKSDSTKFFNDRGTLLGSQLANVSDYDSSLSSSYTGAGLKYAGSWNRTIKAGGSATYAVKTFFGSKNDGSTHALAYSFTDLNATQVDKTLLRNLVLKATYLNESNYTTASWSAFQTALQNAAYALGNPTRSDIADVKNELEAKMNALQTTVKLNANGGSINGSSTASFNVTVGAETTVAYNLSSYIPERTGYDFKGWAITADAESGSTTVHAGLMPTFYATWELDRINITFDNIIDFDKWGLSAVNGTVSDITDTGLTVTTQVGFGESYTYSDFFMVTPGKSYKIDVDVIGSDWDIYIFFCDANNNWVDFNDSLNRYSSNGSGNTSRVFTAPNKDSVVKAQIRLDSNGSGNSVKFNNIRVYEDTGISVSPVNKVVEYDSVYGELPTPERYGYEFTGWYNDKGTKVDASTEMKATTTVNLTSKWTLNSNALVSDAHVLDFGLKAVFAPLDNDTILKNDGAAYSISGVSTDATNASSSVKGTYGTFTVNGNNVEYVPTAIINDKDIAYYHVTVGDKVLVGSMTVFPATVVYYEDDVTSAVKYTNGVANTPDSGFENSGKWTTTGTSKLSSAAQSLSGTIYGYDSVYNNGDTFSMGASHLVSVSKFNNPNSKYSGSTGNSWPVAEFTFAGTGFDLVSVISQETGAIEVRVLDADGNKVYDWIVDTYYGYTLDAEGKWVVDADSSTAICQIPVIGRTDLPYGTYTVQVIPTYTSRLDHQKDGSYDFYLDAIRVYNPMGDSDIDASTVYLNDGEYVVSHQAIRDILVDAKSFGDVNTNQVIYINPGVPEGTFEQYSKAGPKNEVYLAKGQSIAFNMEVSGFMPTSVQVSAHAVNGTADMRFGSDLSNSDAVSISHKTTLYYSVPFTSADYWKDNGNGTYTLKDPIVITNNSDSVLSLCNIKVTSNQLPSVEPLMFMMSDEDFDTAINTASNISALSADDGALFVPDDMVSGTDTDVVATGEDVLVTINTSAEVHALTVNGVNATLVSVNEDGSKTWNYTYTADSRGEQTFTLVAYNADGFASEETTVTVDVQSKIEIFFNKVSMFFSMIIEFLSNLTA